MGMNAVKASERLLAIEGYKYITSTDREALRVAREALMGNPCAVCVYQPPTAGDGRPCRYCPATGVVRSD